MAKIDETKIANRHKSMLKLQETSSPFTPTVRELQSLWNLNTTCAVVLSLSRMVERGLVITKEAGNKTYYFAVDGKDKQP